MFLKIIIIKIKKKLIIYIITNFLKKDYLHPLIMSVLISLFFIIQWKEKKCSP